MDKFKTTIGLEIHVQLATKSKMFCRCNNEAFGVEPNTTVCPVCLGMPGMLPVANEQAILWTIKTGLALNCEIPRISKFDRKHYFYPDLPKGYQISQYDQPFCVGGYLEIDGHKIRLNRIHLEEDAGKLVHKNGDSYSDLNRSGTPLMEIVTEPDMTSPEEAKKFLQELQLIVKYLGVSEASMEKGHLRCDANIDVKDNSGKMSEIVELKNINSFRFVERALKIEEKRLIEKYPDWPEKKKKVTRGYDSLKDETMPQREKEEASDYRYFPEPDLPPFVVGEGGIDLEKIKSETRNLPSDLKAKLISENVPEAVVEKIVQNADHANYVLEGERIEREVALFITEEVNNQINHHKISYEEYKKRVPISHVSELLNFVKSGKISKNTAKQIFSEMVKSGAQAYKIIEDMGLEQVSDDLVIAEKVGEILSKNREEVLRYREGEKKLMGFFMGVVMREMRGQANPEVLQKVLMEELNKND